MGKVKNLTRYTYEKTSFQGWRLSICRRQRQFTRYFSDREFGNEEASFQAALQLRDAIYAELKQQPGEVEAIFARHRGDGSKKKRTTDIEEVINALG